MRNKRNINSIGFTIVELLIAFSIGIMVIVGGVVAANKFNANQKVDSAISEIEESVRLARNYAITRQVPNGYTLGSVEYVGVIINKDTGRLDVVAGNNDNGMDWSHTYMTKMLNIKEVSVTKVDDGELMFSVPEGKLLIYKDGNKKWAVPAAMSKVLSIGVSSVEDSDSSSQVVVEATGLIKTGSQE